MKLFKKLLYPALAFVGILSFTVVASVGSFSFNSSINKSHYTIVDNGSTAEEVIENELKSEGKDPSTAGTITEDQTSVKKLKWAVTLGTGESASYVTIKGVISSGEFTLRIPSSIRGKAVTTISSMAFAGNTKLKKLFLPASITKVKTGALSGCTALEAVEVDSANTTYTAIDGNLCTKADGALVAFAGGKTLTGGKYTLSAGLPMIKAGAFNGSTVTALAGDADAIMTYYFNADFSDTANSGDIPSSDFNKNIYLKWQLKQPTVTANTSAKTISWAVVPYATSYLVQKGTSASSLTDYTTTTATSVDLSSITSGTTYFSVIAKASGFTNSAASAVVSYAAAAQKITLTFVFNQVHSDDMYGVKTITQNGQKITSITVDAGLMFDQIISQYGLSLHDPTDSTDMNTGYEEFWDQGSTTKVFNSNTTITFSYSECLTTDTDIIVYDEKKKKYVNKKLKDITYSDLILVWNFDKGDFDLAKPLWISNTKKATSYTVVEFSDGTSVKFVGPDETKRHRIFNVDTGTFEYIGINTKVGTRTFNSKGEVVTITKLTNREEQVEFANLITYYHFNCFANGILTSCRLNNLYEIKDMKYVKDNRTLASRKDYLDVPDEYYYGLRLSEQQFTDKANTGDTRFSSLHEYVEHLMATAKQK